MVALSRKKGNADYANVSNQFSALIKGEYGKTPVPIDPAFRQQITGDATEHPYDVASYKMPENPELAEFGGVKLAKNDAEYLLMQLLPAVANGFLRKLRETEYQATKPAEPAKEEVKEEAAAVEPITGPTFKAPMGGKVLEISVKPGDTVKLGTKVLVYEAMKMENDLTADIEGKVKRVLVNVGDVIATNQPLVEFE